MMATHMVFTDGKLEVRDPTDEEENVLICHPMRLRPLHREPQSDAMDVCVWSTSIPEPYHLSWLLFPRMPTLEG